MNDNNIFFEIIKNFDSSLIEEIIKLERDNLGPEAALNEWQIPVIIRYGKFITAMQGSPKVKTITGVCEAIRDWNDTRKAFIHSFYVIKEKRNFGIGRELLSYTAGLLESEGFKKIELTVDPENMPALKLYSGFGFEIVKTEYNEYGRGKDRYLMSLKF
jgi:ribosomal protein S18 acetylase RimI-like enzyme